MDLQQIKIVLLGNANVGKSSILYRFIVGEFRGDADPTVGASFMAKVIEVGSNKVKLNIWDTAGQEKYCSFSKMYCRDAKAVIFVFDTNHLESFSNMDKWHQMLSDVNLDQSAMMYIVANKCDLHSLMEFPTNIQDFAYKINAKMFQVSAKTNYGINELFLDIAESTLNTPIITTRRLSLLPRKHSEMQAKKSKCC